MRERTTFNKRIGLVLSTVPRYSETFFRNKISGLQDKGFEVVLFVDYLDPTDYDFGCQVVAAPHFGGGLLTRIWYSFIALVQALFMHPRRSYKLFALNKADGIHLKANIRQLILNQFFFSQNVDWLHFGFGMLAVTRENVAQAMDAKMAVSFRGYDLYLSPLKHPGCYDLLFKKAVRYHVLSEEMKQTLVDYTILPRNIQVITPAINTQFFKGHGLANANPVLQLITVGRLHWKKGLEYTLEALALLKAAGIAFHYTIIGAGSERERLVFAAHQLGLLDCISFTGKLPQEAVKWQLENASIYIQYSIQEGFCNAVLEAQAMGLLCVVSDAEGLQENVLHAETGWVVPKRQPQLLAKQLVQVIELSTVDKEVIRTRAIRRVRDAFNLHKQQAAFLAFYNR
ncbi:glycosyltransferase [Bizionia sp. M204]|uniref:glycosyltransferase n=1 Tax=Bizionia sp. M204 TaxID=2675331 RepID=UPI00204E6DB2|nr:glycosyltransferase [Bizionia sp. M204]UPS91665.1 glycosyltransferase [Bizionia sp. M204]